MPYWREGRRLVGRQPWSRNETLLPVGPNQAWPTCLDADGRCTSIAVGTYANDHHYPGDDWPLAAKSCRWGGRWTGTPFCIPYDALVSADVSNLLMAEKAFSVSHMANGATTSATLILNIGQAAGLAAALAIPAPLSPRTAGPRPCSSALIHDAGRTRRRDAALDLAHLASALERGTAPRALRIPMLWMTRGTCTSGQAKSVATAAG